MTLRLCWNAISDTLLFSRAFQLSFIRPEYFFGTLRFRRRIKGGKLRNFKHKNPPSSKIARGGQAFFYDEGVGAFGAKVGAFIFCVF